MDAWTGPPPTRERAPVPPWLLWPRRVAVLLRSRNSRDAAASSATFSRNDTEINSWTSSPPFRAPCSRATNRAMRSGHPLAPTSAQRLKSAIAKRLTSPIKTWASSSSKYATCRSRKSRNRGTALTRSCTNVSISFIAFSRLAQPRSRLAGGRSRYCELPVGPGVYSSVNCSDENTGVKSSPRPHSLPSNAYAWTPDSSATLPHHYPISDIGHPCGNSAPQFEPMARFQRRRLMVKVPSRPLPRRVSAHRPRMTPAFR
jgi:hypothetical protein